MRYLCICREGIVRSGAAVNLLRQNFGQDALAASYRRTPDDTMAMLCRWADVIVLMRPHYSDRIPPDYHPKIRILDVGEDVWGNPLHPDLYSKLIPRMVGWGLKWKDLA